MSEESSGDATGEANTEGAPNADGPHADVHEGENSSHERDLEGKIIPGGYAYADETKGSYEDSSDKSSYSADNKAEHYKTNESGKLESTLTKEELRSRKKDTNDGVARIILNETTNEIVIENRPGFYFPAETQKEGESPGETDIALGEEEFPSDLWELIKDIKPELLGIEPYTDIDEQGNKKEGVVRFYIYRINPDQFPEHGKIWSYWKENIRARTEGPGADANEFRIISLYDLAKMPKNMFAFNKNNETKMIVDSIMKAQLSDKPYLQERFGVSETQMQNKYEKNNGSKPDPGNRRVGFKMAA